MHANIRLLDWKKEKFNYSRLVAIETIGDGSCLIHAIAASCLVCYRTDTNKEGTIDRRKLARKIRNDLANYLMDKVIEDDKFQTIIRYDLLGNGNIKELGKTDKKYSLSSLQQSLRSRDYIGYELFELISDFFNKDLYFLDNTTKDVLTMEINPGDLYKQRDSIVILFDKDHYELIGINYLDRGLKTYFSYDHPLIQAIKQRMIEQQFEARERHVKAGVYRKNSN